MSENAKDGQHFRTNQSVENLSEMLWHCRWNSRPTLAKGAVRARLNETSMDPLYEFPKIQQYYRMIICEKATLSNS
jgi:hypothetical protein